MWSYPSPASGKLHSTSPVRSRLADSRCEWGHIAAVFLCLPWSGLGRTFPGTIIILKRQIKNESCRGNPVRCLGQELLWLLFCFMFLETGPHYKPRVDLNSPPACLLPLKYGDSKLALPYPVNTCYPTGEQITATLSPSDIQGPFFLFLISSMRCHFYLHSAKTTLICLNSQEASESCFFASVIFDNLNTTSLLTVMSGYDLHWWLLV